MPPLRELQERFAAHLLAGTGGTRLEPYRRNVLANWCAALAATYPVVRALVGEAFFESAAQDYSWVHPSRSGNLDEFGHAFPQFIARYMPAAALPWLPDVAALERALDEASRAPEAATTAGSMARTLSSIPPERLPTARLLLHPAARLVACRHGAMRLWQIHQPGHAGEFDAPLEPAPEWLLVSRDENGVAVERITQAEFAWLDAVRAGHGMARAQAEALEIDARFDLVRAMPRRVVDSTLIGVLP